MRKLTLKLTKRHDGRVCKRVDGRLRIWSDEEAARRDLLALIAVREASPPAAVAAASAPAAQVPTSVKAVFNAFLADREARMEAGRIEKGTFLDYKDALESFIAGLESWKPGEPDVVALLKREVPVEALEPPHFAHARAFQAKGRGAYMLERRVQGVRSAFRWAVDVARAIPRLPYFGDEYHKPSAKAKRADKRKSRERGGEKCFSVEELRAILASPSLKRALKAAVWLALNSGMYSADCADLRTSDLKSEGRNRVVDRSREKTGIRQKFVLWKQTASALDEWLKVRPEPRGNTPRDLIFVTIHGNPFASESVTRDREGRVVGGGETDSFKLLFNRLLVSLGIKRHGVGFGAFRPTHTTAAARHPDANARKVVRGHKIVGIEEHYDYANLEALKSVTDLVYNALVAPALRSKPSGKSTPTQPSPVPSRIAHRRSRAKPAA